MVDAPIIPLPAIMTTALFTGEICSRTLLALKSNVIFSKTNAKLEQLTLLGSFVT